MPAYIGNILDSLCNKQKKNELRFNAPQVFDLNLNTYIEHEIKHYSM